jgi:hypothetical protein
MPRYTDIDKLISEYDRVHVGPAGGARKLMVEAPIVDVAPRAEVAREIFEEIYEIMNSLYSRVQHDCVGRHGDDPHTIMLVGKLQGIKYLGDEIAELKNKYAEGGNER